MLSVSAFSVSQAPRDIFIPQSKREPEAQFHLHLRKIKQGGGETGAEWLAG